MLANGAKETTTTTGTGTVTLSAVTGFPRFSDILGVGTLVDYAIRSGDSWEWGVGTLGAGNTLGRSIIIAKYESGTYSDTPATALSLTGTSDVFCTAHATTNMQGGSAGLVTPSNWRITSALAGNTVGTTVSAFAGQAFAYPFLLLSAVRATGLGVECTTAVASSTVTLGLYAVGTDGRPSTALLKTGAISTATTGFKTGSVTPRIIPPGLYWSVLHNAVGDTPAFRSMRATGVTGLSGVDMFTRLTLSGIGSTLPDSLVGAATTFFNTDNPQVIAMGVVTS